MEGLYRRAVRRRPRRWGWAGGGLVAGVGLGAALAMGGATLLGVILGGLVVIVAGAWGTGRGAVVRTGGLRWTQRAMDLLEIELVGDGRSWRRDLRGVAESSLALDWEGWRSLKVMMVTAVFPVRWLRIWGFEIRDCGRATKVGYRLMYAIAWLGWSMKAVVKGRRRPRFRRRTCVEATHSMGAWMEVIDGLPLGLRR